MQGDFWIVNSDAALENCIKCLREQYEAHKYLKCQIKTGKQRSLTKNALSHVWYQQLDKTAFSDYAAGYARCYCKAHFGIQLAAEDDDFREKYNNLIRQRFSYEEKLELMDWLPVTRLLTDDQMGRYLHTMQQVFAEGGYILTTPKDSEYEQWSKAAA